MWQGFLGWGRHEFNELTRSFYRRKRRGDLPAKRRERTRKRTKDFRSGETRISRIAQGGEDATTNGGRKILTQRARRCAEERRVEGRNQTATPSKPQRREKRRDFRLSSLRLSRLCGLLLARIILPRLRDFDASALVFGWEHYGAGAARPRKFSFLSIARGRAVPAPCLESSPLWFNIKSLNLTATVGMMPLT